jgi:DMSO/TMAO reductase YedYZ molybdopterin-dependent catalytic subunit
MPDTSRPLPPNQQAIEHLPVLHVGGLPPFDSATWELRLEGAVHTPRVLRYAEVRALPAVRSTSDFHCVEGWSVLDCTWEGVLVSALCDLVSPLPEARFVTIGCEGEYTTSLTLQDMLRPDVLLAWGLNGHDLTPGHGYPLRLVVPHKYVYKAAKWVRSLRFTEEKELGYWEARGYHDNADPWKEERRA